MKVHTESRQTYLYASADGDTAIPELKSSTAEILRIAVAEGLTKVLLDGRGVTADLSTLDRYEYAVFLADELRKLVIDENAPVLQVAAVVTEPIWRPGGFGEMVARNRGADFKATDSMDDALAWLVEKPADGTRLSS